MAASVRARLANLARAQGVAFDYVLNRYAVERLLHRLSSSTHRGSFVLKGATLLRVWSPSSLRPTRDVDFLGFGPAELDDVAGRVREICETTVPDDGITFRGDTIVAARIKDDAEYEGVRVRLQAELAGARIPVQIDVGFGDAVQPREERYPVLLENFEAPSIRTYPRATVIAEKVHAMVDLGLTNSRMKDFWDIDQLARQFDFDGREMLDALRATFERRGTPVPTLAPVGLTPAFFADADKLKQWKAFLRRTSLSGTPLPQLIEELSRFILPLFEAAHGGPDLDAWAAGGPWRSREGPAS
jgi:predicted nucleotidyltransferase component of viral defense system